MWRKTAFFLIVAVAHGCTQSQALVTVPEVSAVSDLSGMVFGALPSSGTSEYIGALDFSGGQLHAHGDLHLTVDFGNDAVDGYLKNIEGRSENLEGLLTMSNGYLCRCADPKKDYVFEAQIGGKLASSATLHVIDAVLLGTFESSILDVTLGTVTGTIQTDGNDNDPLFGTFRATR